MYFGQKFIFFLIFSFIWTKKSQNQFSNSKSRLHYIPLHSSFSGIIKSKSHSPISAKINAGVSTTSKTVATADLQAEVSHNKSLFYASKKVAAINHKAIIILHTPTNQNLRNVTMLPPELAYSPVPLPQFHLNTPPFSLLVLQLFRSKLLHDYQ